MERIVKGIWIPIEIWQDRSLSWNEKILLMEIDSFTSRGHECFISNEYIANLLGVTERCASKYLSHLIDAGYVRMVRFDGRQRFVESTIQFQAEWNNHSMQDGNSVPHTETNEYIDNNSLYKGSSTFHKPTLDEVREYCHSRKNNVDPEQFLNFYESKGWVVGKSPMKDWRAAVRTWEKRETPRRRSPLTRSESVLEHNLKVMDRMYGTDMHSQAYGKEVVVDEQ